MNSELMALYEKYQISTASLFDEGSPFSLLLTQVEAGHNEYNHFSRKLQKIIDIKWVDAIENCIIPLDTIIRNPRRFIVQEEEIVPIERAKKISAESIRHLAQHTDMINSVTKDGMVTPNRILNVFREESFDIYENRFIYTLLINVKNFIEKRYAVIFKLSGDENIDIVNMNSKAYFGREEVNYSIRLDAKKTSAMDVDEDSDVLARVERIRRIIDEFLCSQFAHELSGCALVRPPITRTNLITKDPNFKQCLDLWIFVETYNEVGYEVNVSETNEPLEQEYINELNKLMAFNYMILKSHVKDSKFSTDDLKYKKNKLKPKFIKNFIEELVNNYDITDDEVRRVFLDQINKHSNRRKAEEEKIEKAIARCLDAENALKAELSIKAREEAKRKAEIEQRKKDQEAAREQARIEREKARIEREEARKKAAEERKQEAERKAREKAAREKAAALEKERLAKEKEKARDKAAREKAKALEKERLAKEKQKARDKAAREKAAALEKERLAKEKEKAREKAAREKAKAQEAERIAKEKEKAREKAAREKAAALEKERLAKEKEKAREKAAREKAKAQEAERIAKEKEKARIKAAQEKAKAKEKERIAREKEKAREKAAREKEKLKH